MTERTSSIRIARASVKPGVQHWDRCMEERYHGAGEVQRRRDGMTEERVRFNDFAGDGERGIERERAIEATGVEGLGAAAGEEHAA